ncbi:hypothetical protein BX616_006511 [Lobosporangium transversale]|uniref:Peptide hydrolase n=1 Tax=Lobosporangium transversale TaxID=64571 RepID=A0A1Y2GGP8_9FUNG|nr:hypothetical protein BCR41DRAFT_388066 [Lobosporangium transversale]KAF9915285.1 hypothetical protein BX616_006511 [Lobosporangium transversale]ORZ10329.1 hypothetical protein BCR41DRAFT_388066 [Lobosporangium transversale]|eukprot:XP_021879236.1 hypothetical protein BCR41DRAFT_388066 [Lobosporangium transversale]
MPVLKQRTTRRKGLSGENILLLDEKTIFSSGAHEAHHQYPVGRKQKSALVSWSLFLSFLFLLALIAYQRHYSLPTPILQDRDPQTGALVFSEANVRKYTGHLSKDIGLRLVGTASADEAEKYLVKEIKALQQQAKVEAARQTDDTVTTGAEGAMFPKFETWVQVEDGSHRFDFMSKVVMKMYTNMTNIIVRLSCGPECDKNAILLNAHYDTTLGSPGAADDALGVGVQMELIRILSQQPALTKNSVIFLFNGGEESLQDASHSFITQHELRGTVRAIINLESCGTTGPEILFQANSRPMIDAYRKVPYPHGTVIANDVFATGIILSDTDFRQFVDHGNLTGLDMAVYTNSYLYHTHLDLNEHLASGLPQHMGENTLALVQYLGNKVDLANTNLEKTSSVVFYDVLGFFFVSYSVNTAVLLHLAIGGLALFALVTTASRPTIKSTLSVLVSAAASLIAPNLVALLLVKVAQTPMRWFSHEWLPLLVFGPASLAGMFLVQYLFHDSKASHSANELSVLSGIQFFFSVAMASATYAGLASSYMGALYAFSYSLGLIYNQKRLIGVQQQYNSIKNNDNSGISRSNSKVNMMASVDFTTYIVASIIPSTYFFYSAYSLLDIMVPLTGRTGVDTFADHIMAVVSGLFIFSACPPILAFTHRFGQQALKRIIGGLLLLQLAVFILSSTCLQPFDKMHPKRIYAQHLRNLTSGETLVYVAHADPGPIYENYVQNLEQLFETKATWRSGVQNPGDWNAIYPFSQFLDSFVLDTTPFIRSQTKNQTIAKSTRPLTELIQDAPKLVAENVSFDPQTGLRRLRILCTHPNYILTVINFDAQLTSWSLSSDIPSKDRFHYVIRNAGGYRADGWRLDLEYKAPKGPDDKLRVEITSMETEGFDWRAESERELVGSGEIGVMRKLVKATPDFIALTYFSTVASTFEL